MTYLTSGYTTLTQPFGFQSLPKTTIGNGDATSMFLLIFSIGDYLCLF